MSAADLARRPATSPNEDSTGLSLLKEQHHRLLSVLAAKDELEVSAAS
ncbi:hypothetical protein [Streptomyces griseorubiginosus]